VREARVALETVLSKQRLATSGAEALKSLAEACQPHLAAPEAAPVLTSKPARRTRPVAGVKVDASAEHEPAGLPDERATESATERVPAITLPTDARVEATIAVEPSAGGIEVSPAYFVEADPPVGWRVPEAEAVEEPLVSGPVIQSPPAAGSLQTDSDFDEEILDLGELLDDEPADARTPEEVMQVDEAVVAAPLVAAEGAAELPVPDRRFLTVASDLVELREEEPQPVAAPPGGQGVEEPLIASPALRAEIPTIERPPERSAIDDILDLLERCDETPPTVEAKPEPARVEEPLEMAGVEEFLEMAGVEDLLEIPVEDPAVARPVLRDEVPTIEVYPDGSTIEEVLALLERRDEVPTPVEAKAEPARVEEPLEIARVEEPFEPARVEESIFTSHLAPTEPPVGWRVRDHHRADVPAVDVRLFRESTQGEESGGDASAADDIVTVPPASIEPVFTGAVLPADWLVDVEVAGTAQGGQHLPRREADAIPSLEPEKRPSDDVRPPLADAVPAFDVARPAPVYARRGEPLPDQSHADMVEHAGDAEPAVPRVAPSIQRVRAAAARRRLTRLRTGITQSAQALGRMCGAALASAARASSSMAQGVAGALVALARVVLLSMRAFGAAGAATLSVLARGLRAGARLLGAVCVLAVASLGRVAAAIGRGVATAAAGSLRSLRAIGRGGRAVAAWTLLSSARGVRAARAGGVAILTLMARVVRGTALAGRGAAALLLAVSGRAAGAAARAVRTSAVLVLSASAWVIRSAGSGGVAIVTALARTFRASAHAAHGVGSTAVAGMARALRVTARAGRAGGARGLAALTFAARATVRASSSTATASGPVVTRACRATVGAARTTGAAALAVPVRAYYLVGDLAERIPRPALRPGYLLVALLVIAAVAGVPYAKARWLAFKPQTGNIRIESARPGLSIRIDGVARGTTPLSAAVEAGRHRVEVDAGGRTRAQDVVVTAGQDTMVQLSGDPTRGAGTLRLTSEPAGAEVWLDGVFRGTAPVTIEHVVEGSHTVLVREAGGSVRQTVRVRADETVEATIPIRPGWLAVFAPIRLDIVEDGRVIGTTEGGRIPARPGEHTLEFVGGPIGFRETRTVVVKPGDVAALTIELPTAMLEVIAPDDAEILIDGQLIGKAPLAPVAVAAGTREVSMRHPTLGEQRQMTTITYRTPNRVVFEPRD